MVLLDPNNYGGSVETPAFRGAVKAATPSSWTAVRAESAMTNPPFHPKGFSAASYELWGRLTRGMMVEAFPSDGMKKPRTLNFGFNPTDYTLSYTTDDPGTLTPGPTANPADQKWKAMGNSGSLTFSLFFDRTYELWDSALRHHPLYRVGAEADIQHLRAMLGMTAQQQQPMQIRYFYFFIGGVPAPRWYGYVSGLNIVYAHFSANMVPVRASADLSVVLIPPTSAQYRKYIFH